MEILNLILPAASSEPLGLHCHCETCPNRTCVAGPHGVCAGEIFLDSHARLREVFFCINTNSPMRLVENLTCSTNFSWSSNSFVRCCSSHHFCNYRRDFLPSVLQIRKVLMSFGHSLVSNITTNETLHKVSGAVHEVVGTDGSEVIVGAIAETNNTSHALSPPLNLRTPLNLHAPRSEVTDTKLILAFLSGILLVLMLVFTERLSSRFQWYRGRSSSVPPSDNTEANVQVVTSDNLRLETVASKSTSLDNQPLLDEPPPPPAVSEVDPQQCPGSSQVQYRQLPSCLSAYNLSLASDSLAALPTEPKDVDDTEHTSSIASDNLSSSPLEDTSSSGSGTGLPYLQTRSIIDDIEFMSMLGRGKYGTVYYGLHRGAPVAAKVFTDMQWKRELETYQTSLIRHKNILTYMGADYKTQGSYGGFWIVMEYHSHGSLWEFLSTHTIVIKDCIRMAYSIACGLAHLHLEVRGTDGKPSIAHRDIKSANILVKQDGTCCVADLGIAASYDSQNNVVSLPPNGRVGTIRYLAPEVLRVDNNIMDFETIKQGDMYSLGLVYWELLRRTSYKNRDQMPSEQINDEEESETELLVKEEKKNLEMPKPIPGTSAPITKAKVRQRTRINLLSVPGMGLEQEDLDTDDDVDAQIDLSYSSMDDSTSHLAYEVSPQMIPYADYLPETVSIENMRWIVCELGLRPKIEDRWSMFTPMRDFLCVIKELWYDSPYSRLTALRTRKTLTDIAKFHFSQFES